ncbi:OmpA family protein [Jejudonia soesokkakensis]|uniref:OmpA family protein n=1 Tax=Jejudonia soesokkakensis TaxID=1323432 RepID=A0ABW2MSQ3_9FLAO
MKKVTFFLFLFGNICFAQQKIDTVSLYFENDVSALTTAHLQKIDSIQSDTLPIISLKINGYANSFASFEYNQKLSDKRATNIAEAFSDSINVQTIGFGEIDDPSAAYRRADIIVTRQFHTITKKEVVPEPTLENEMKTAVSGEKITLQGMQFYPGVDIIRESSIPVAKKLFFFLTENPSVKIKISGHVCCGRLGIPSSIDGMNNRTRVQNLSEARAAAVYNYLVEKGISKDRMQYEGLAFLFPLGKTDDDDRRVEIEILSK